METEHPTIEGRIVSRSVEKRELVGRLVSWGETIKVRGRNESFVKGAFDGIEPNAVLFFQHQYDKPIGRMTELESRDDGAYATFKVANTALGDEILQLADEGVLTDLSIGFIPGEHTNGVHRRISALPEVSVVSWGAYPSAKILDVRDNFSKENTVLDNTINEAEAVEAQVTEAAEAVDLSDIEARLADMSEKIARFEAFKNVPELPEKRSIEPVEWFRAEVRALLGDPTEKRDLANVVGTLGGSSDASSLVVEEFLGDQLVSIIDARRPFMRNAGRIEMPQSGYARIPKITQHTNVGVRTTQFGNATSRALVASDTQYAAKWYDGAVEVSLELLATADLNVYQLLFDDLLGMYAQVTEAAAIADVEGAITAYGGAMPTDSYENFAKDIATHAMAVRSATGQPATKLAIPYDTWPSIIAFVDANDRRQFTAGDHSDGNATLVAESFTLPGGINVFAAGVTKPILFNEAALKIAEQPPTRVESNHVETMSRQLGLIGRTLIVPRIPDGIIYLDEQPSSSSSSS